jgi:hypothetical protein
VSQSGTQRSKNMQPLRNLLEPGEGERVGGHGVVDQRLREIESVCAVGEEDYGGF